MSFISLDVVIDSFRFEKPLEWGYYLRSALLEERGDCDALASWNNTGAFGIVPNPHYWRVDSAKQEPCVSAFLVAVNLRDKQGKSIASYLADKQYQPLLLNPAGRVAVLLKALRHEGEKEKAAVALTKLGSSAVPALLEALDAEDTSFRVSVLRVLEQMGPRAAGAVPRLVRLKSDLRITKDVRQAAVNALTRVADEKLLAKIRANEDRLASCTLALKDVKPSVRAKALADLVKMGPEAAAAIPVLIESLADRNPAVRAQAATALAAVGPEAVTALADSLKSKALWTRQGAVEALGLLGPAAKKAVSALMEALQDRNVLVRRGAACALGRIGP